MPLYTVRMYRKRKIWSYDDRGHQVNEREERIEITYTDLPHVTALRYQFLFPDNGVSIEQQPGTADYKPPRSAKRDYYETPDEYLTVPSAAERDAMVDAAIRGDMGAAISGEAI